MTQCPAPVAGHFCLRGREHIISELPAMRAVFNVLPWPSLKTIAMNTNLEKRVFQLEKSLRFYQMMFSTVVLAALVIGFMSFTNKNKQVPEKITAKAFEVVDDNGKVLVNLSTYNGNGAITTFNKDGSYLVDIVSNTSGFANVNLYDGKGKPTMQLYNVKGGGGALAIKNKEGNDAVMLSLMTSGSGHLSLNNSSGASLLWLGETSERNGDLKLYNKNGRQAIRLACTDMSDGSLELFNNTGTRTLYATTDVNGSGSVSTYNNTGTKNGKLPQ